MTAPWFYVEQIPDVGTEVTLDAQEARHATGPRRLRAGDPLTLFDGRGGVAEAELLDGARGRVTLRTTSPRQQRAPGPARHVVSALPKGDRLSVLLGMGTQLGMTSFTPLLCERGVTRPGKGAGQRWTRIVREACKQSRRAHAPALQEGRSPGELVVALEPDRQLIVLDPEGVPARRLCDDGRIVAADPILFVVGPEGGLTPDERALLLEAGGCAVSLGPGVLRIETAVAAGLAVFEALASGAGSISADEAP